MYLVNLVRNYDIFIFKGFGNLHHVTIFALFRPLSWQYSHPKVENPGIRMGDILGTKAPAIF